MIELPYRKNEAPLVADKIVPIVRDKALEEKFRGGTLVRPPREACHCSEPGFALSFWFWITFRAFPVGCVWVCPHGYKSKYSGGGMWGSIRLERELERIRSGK
jgi:hypothetical protein